MAAVSAPPAVTPIATFTELRHRARQVGPVQVAVIAAHDEVALTAANQALEQGIAAPVLIGDATRIRAKAKELGPGSLLAQAALVASDDPAATAVRMAREGSVSVLLKGHLRTDELLHAVLDKETGLRSGRLLSDVLLYEDTLRAGKRLVGITDGGLNVLPTFEQKQQIVHNAIEVMRCIGIARPKIAIMSATEAVSAAVPSTVDAQQLIHTRNEEQQGDGTALGDVREAIEAIIPRTILQQQRPRIKHLDKAGIAAPRREVGAALAIHG